MLGSLVFHGGGGGGDEEAQVNGVKKGGGGGGVAPPTREGSVNRKSVGLVEACMIPGVIPFALCLFFAKLVAYTFLYWLPFYLTQTGESSIIVTFF